MYIDIHNVDIHVYMYAHIVDLFIGPDMQQCTYW